MKRTIIAGTFLPIDTTKLTQVAIIIVCCLVATVTTAEANGDLTVSGVILGDDFAIANKDCTVFANGGKLTTNLDGLVVCADDDNSSSALSALVARVETLEADNVALKADNVTLKAQVESLQTALDANTAADVLAHHDKYTDAEAVAAVGPHSPDFTTLLADVSRITDPNTGQDTLRFSDMNVQIVNGTGTTNSATGTGNLIIGYNDLRGSGDDRSGSHMLVNGWKNNYTSWGGMVMGVESETSSSYASVSGGENNTASGDYASVSGGYGNIASGAWSSVSGGSANTASVHESSVSGGKDNQANSAFASVSGGWSNAASGDYASISGGFNNSASGDASSVSGGRDNVASANMSSVSGGNGNQADSLFASVSGGWSNAASGDYASISGGFNNSASGDASSVSGGRDNVASGDYASAAGGENNEASGRSSSVAGGGGPLSSDGNRAFADYSTVSPTYRIGDMGPGGGIVFHVTDDGQHGLEAAPVDQDSAEWSDDYCYFTGAGIFFPLAYSYNNLTGAQFSQDILRICNPPGRAAEIADNYWLSGFGDWYLPSMEELYLMYYNLHRAQLGGFAYETYWSSAHGPGGSPDKAWVVDFNDAGASLNVSKASTHRIRAIRSF